MHICEQKAEVRPRPGVPQGPGGRRDSWPWTRSETLGAWEGCNWGSAGEHIQTLPLLQNIFLAREEAPVGMILAVGRERLDWQSLPSGGWGLRVGWGPHLAHPRLVEGLGLGCRRLVLGGRPVL